MAKSSNYWDKRALQRLTDAEKLSEEYITSIKRIYEQAYRDVAKEIQRTYRAYSKNTGLDVEKLKELLTIKETDKVWKTLKRQGLDEYVKNNYKSRISRLEQIQAQIYAKAKMIYPKEELAQTMAYKGVINESYYKAVYDTQMGTGLDFAFSKLDENTIKLLLNEKWSGLNYSQRIWKNTDYLADALSSTLGGALLSGQSIQKTTRQIKERFNVSKYYAERLVRTETNHFNNRADALAYEELGVKEYVFVATLDSRTSPMCQSHDNKRYKYKDKKEGVNYPPLHPNCRSKTRGYVNEEVEKTLKRRARNPVTGRNEIVDNISYQEWAKQNGIINNKPKNIVDKPVKEHNKIRNTVKIDINDLPSQLTTSKEIKNTTLYINSINNSKNADPKVAKVYSLMGKVNKYDFKVSHAKDSSIKYTKNIYTNEINNFKLTIPNIKDAEDIGSINTILHENMHFIDFMAGENKTSYISIDNKDLLNVVKNTDSSISSDIQDIFTKFNETAKLQDEAVVSKYKPMYQKLNEDIKNKTISYDEYKKEWSKVNKLWREGFKENEYLQRNYLGGGVNNLQDIYDALSGGVYRDTDKVKYGHGTKYYRSYETRVKEIVANYGALSISRPDLIDLLKADKPALVNELDKLMDSIISKYGGV